MRNQCTFVSFGIVCLASFAANAQIIFSESFNYPDGSLTSVSSQWTTVGSTTANPVQVAGGQVAGLFSGSSSQDVQASLGASYQVGVLYAGFDLSVSASPTGGDYFFHFGKGSTYFRGRVFVEAPSLTGFRLGLENDGNSTSILSQDLALNTSYRVVLQYDINNATSALWINSIDWTTPTLMDSTPATKDFISTFNIRQGGSGHVTGVNVDNVVVTGDFGLAAVPEPSTWAQIVGTLLVGYAIWRRCSRRVQSAG